jgi:membrane protein YqaA with SNARE-associated domain
MLDVAGGLWAHASLFLTAFAAATFLPFSSEAALVLAIKAGAGSTAGLLTVATAGNVAGSLFNWWLGLNIRRYEGRRWFPFTPETIETASHRFRRFGIWALLLSWLPVIGDPLTFIAGVLRVPLKVFLPLVAAGKLGRYLAVIWAINAV